MTVTLGTRKGQAASGEMQNQGWKVRRGQGQEQQ